MELKLIMKSKIKDLMNLNLHARLFRITSGYRMAIGKIVFLNAGYSLSGILLAIITKTFIDNAMAGDYQMTILYGCLFAGVLLVQLVCSSYLSYSTIRLTETMRNGLQIKLLADIYSKKWLDLNKYKTGDLLLRIYSDIGSIVTALTATLPQMFALVLQFIVAFVLVFTYSPLLAVLTFLVTPVTVFVGLVIGQKLKVVQKKIQEADALKNAIINESLQNIIILKSFDFLVKNLQKISRLQTTHFDYVKKKNIIAIKSNVILTLGYEIGFFAAIVFGTYGLAFQGITVGTFTAFVQLVGQIQGPIQGLAIGIPQYISSLSSVERIQELELLEDDWQQDENDLPADFVLERIVLEDVFFSYTANRPILTDLKMIVNRGEKVAIVGPSGEGKTTLILLLLALTKPDCGQVLIESLAGERYTIGANTRRFFSYVPQVNTLFSGSIYDNFLLNHEVSDEELERALVASCCKEFIDALPRGLDTLMGERGIGLSQGQAQRITIARALLHKSPILIFDEATSALDLETEHKLIENLKRYYPECTLIAVTHRESLFDICDRVYRLKNGRLNIEV